MSYTMHLKKIDGAVEVGGGRVKANVLIFADEESAVKPVSGESGDVEGLAGNVVFASSSVMIVIPTGRCYIFNETAQEWEYVNG